MLIKGEDEVGNGMKKRTRVEDGEEEEHLG
jgi:hypothetical protein